MSLRRLLAAPILVAAALLAPAAALGAAYHPFLDTLPTSYEDACGLALHSGLYVSANYQNTVFTPSGKLAPESSGSGPCKIELDAAGDLYVNNWHENVVKYSAGDLVAGAGTVIDSANPTGLAVEQVTGDVYVAHRRYVSKYGPEGALLQTIGLDQLEEGFGVALSEFPATLGDLYVPDAATHTVKIFDASGALIGEMDGIADPQGGFKYLRDGEIAVDNSPTSPSYGHVYVLDAIGHGLSERAPAVFDEFNAEGQYRGQVTGFTDAEPSAIAIEPTPGPSNGDLYITTGNTEESKVFLFGPTPPAKPLKVVREGSGGGTVNASPKGIVCGPACIAEYNEGQSVTLFATPDAHSAFSGWTVVGSEPCPGGEGASCTVQMAKAVEVRANFTEPAQETLTMGVSGQGTVSSDPGGLSCPSSCEEHFAQGRQVVLKAHPSPHQRIASWSGCTVQANQDECRLTMSAAAAVSATFAPIPQATLTISLAGAGQGTVSTYPPGIYCPPTCAAGFDEGSTVYVMAATAPGSSFGGFSGSGCVGTTPICAVVMGSNETIGAQFTASSSGQAPVAARARLRITSARTDGAVALVGVDLGPESGTLIASGRGLQPLERKVGAGRSTLRLRLKRRTRRRLGRLRRLRLHLSLGFIPRSGSRPEVVGVELRFRRPAASGRAR